MPKVSVIIPIYGVERFIERCVDSLFNQTLDNIEFIFIDDCTPDTSIDLLRAQIIKYQQRIDEQNWSIRLERMSVNSGQAAVRRFGISLATGQYVIHCDSDDWIHRDMYRLMYEKAIRESADVVVCDYAISDGTSIIRNITGCINTDIELFIQNILLQKNSWSLCNKMFKISSYCKADIVYPDGDMGEDFVLTTQLLLNSNKVAYIPLALYNYFYNNNSITKVASDDRKMSNFQMNKKNSDIVYRVLRTYRLENRYSKALVSNKWYIKKQLWNTRFDSVRRKLWKETYKEINTKVLINPYINFKDKVKFILTYLNLYPKRSMN